MKLRFSIAFGALMTSACSLVRPVNVAPPPPPRAFTTSFDSADGARPSDSGERVTKSEVWWSAFADPALDAAIQEAFRNNHILRDVRGLIYENMLDVALPQGWWWPLQVGIVAPTGIQRVQATIPPDQNEVDENGRRQRGTSINYNVGAVNLSATYQLDVWGQLDAQRRAGMNFAEQQRQLTEARVQDLAVQIAQIWFDILETRELRQLTFNQIKYNQELFDLVKARFEQHLSPRLAVLQQEQVLLNLQSQVPLITTRIALLNSQLNGLLGRVPSPADNIVPQDRQLPKLPPAPGIGTPRDLDANTPEMRVARLRVEEVEHRVNQHLASWLPTIQLVGSIGAQTFGTSEPTLRDSVLGVTMTWIMFDGRRITEARQLPMTLERRKLQYELALQTAIGRVQDAVIRENNQATSLQSLHAQVELGGRLLAEARRQFEQGQSDYLTVLTALNNLTELERADLQAQRLLLNHRTEVYRSLGGNWSYDVTERRE